MIKFMRICLYIYIVIFNYKRLPDWILIKFSKLFMVKQLSNKTIRNNAAQPSVLKVSVVFPTNNGITNGVEKLINSLLAQTLRPIEIIAVDSGSVDGTQDFLKANGVKLIDNSKNIFHHAHSRNLGADKALGDFILFTVDDAVFLDKYWIENAVSLLLKTNSASISGVQKTKNTEDYYSLLKSIWHINQYEKIYHAISIIKCPKWLAYIYKSLSLKPKYAPIDDTNHLVRKSVFDKIKFSTNTVEDLEFGARLLLSGYSVVFSKFLEIEHGHKYISGKEVSYSRRIALDQRIFRDEFALGIFNNFTSHVLSSSLIELLSYKISLAEDNERKLPTFIKLPLITTADYIEKIELVEKMFGRGFVESSRLNTNLIQKIQQRIIISRVIYSFEKAYDVLRLQLSITRLNKLELIYRYMVVNYIVSLVAFSSMVERNLLDELDISDWS
jgi:rhamnosyltransferase